ncbi:ArsC family reductase [Leptothrix sp. BB-4]
MCAPRGSEPLPRPAGDDTVITLYGIPNCDTVKKARAWLEEQGLPYAFHDFKKAGVPEPELDGWLAAVGWETLVNRSGTTWRKLDEAVRAAVVDTPTARALMLAQSSVIKRPVVRWPDGHTTVGFKPDDWSRHIAKAR